VPHGAPFSKAVERDVGVIGSERQRMIPASTSVERLLGDAVERSAALVESLLPEEVKAYLQGSAYTMPAEERAFPVRAWLLLLSARRYGAPEDRAIKMAAAIEMVHYASLLHERVGRWSRNGGEAEAAESAARHQRESMDVLLGDFFFARAASLIIADGTQQIIQDMLETSLRSAELQAQILSLDLDVGPETERGGVEECFSVVAGKISLIVSLSARVGARLGGAEESEVRALSGYGEALGRVIRIADDVRSWRGILEERSAELVEPELTYPLLLARGERPRESVLAPAGLSRPQREAALRRCAAFLAREGYLDRSTDSASNYAAEACRYLEGLSFSEEIEALRDIAARALVQQAASSFHRPPSRSTQ